MPLAEATLGDFKLQISEEMSSSVTQLPAQEHDFER